VVDRNMSDSNLWGRNNKNIRNHIIVLNSVMNDVIQNKKKCIDAEILDYKQCFDSMWHAILLAWTSLMLSWT
jgi:hypothetical protein